MSQQLDFWKNVSLILQRRKELFFWKKDIPLLNAISPPCCVMLYPTVPLFS